jgi:hypothetical protein
LPPVDALEVGEPLVLVGEPPVLVGDPLAVVAVLVLPPEPSAESSPQAIDTSEAEITRHEAIGERIVRW